MSLFMCACVSSCVCVHVCVFVCTDHLSHLEADMCTVDARLFGAVNSVEHSQVCRLLEALRVKRLTARDVVQHHILPTFKSEEWKVRRALTTRLLPLHTY